MGKRLHVCSKLIVEYSDSSYFNWQCEEFHRLMDALGVYYTNDVFDDDFEISREDFERGIYRLKNLNLETEHDQEEIEEAVANLNMSISDVIGILEKYLDESDKSNDYLVFSFF